MPEVLQPIHKKQRWMAPAIGASLLAASVVGIGAAYRVSEPHLRETFAMATYVREYIGEDDCLYDTPFDTRNGATITPDTIDGNLVLTVDSSQTTSSDPSQLRFKVGDGILRPEIQFYDQSTAQLLADNHC